MSGIFISYRREDAAGYAGRLYDRLSARIGAEHVFMDVEGIEPGTDFVDAIGRAVGSCEAVIVIIGNEWLAADAAGRRRIDDPADFVRLEIATALARNVRIVPVLVDDATMPRADELPSDLAPLARRQAIELSHKQWESSSSALIRAMEKILDHPKPGAARVALPEEPQRASSRSGQEPGGAKADSATVTDDHRSRHRRLWALGVAGVLAVTGGALYLVQPWEQEAPPPLTEPDQRRAPETLRASPQPGADTPVKSIVAQQSPEQSTPAVAPEPAPVRTPALAPETTPERKPAVAPEPKPAVAPEPRPAVAPEPRPAVAPERKPAVTEQPVPERKPVATPAPERKPAATPAAERKPVATPAPERKPAATPAQDRTLVATPVPVPERKPADEPVPVPEEKAAVVAPVAKAPVAAVPSAYPQPGDTWDYRYTSMWKNVESRVVSHRISAVSDGQIRETMSSTVDGERSSDTKTFGADTRFFEWRGKGHYFVDFNPFLQAFAAMAPGTTWTSLTRPDDDPFYGKWFGQGRVTGWDNVSVPAGTFKALKVEVNTNRHTSGSAANLAAVPARMVYVLWYAPEAKRIVKQVRSAYSPFSHKIDEDTFELVKYRVQ